MMPQMSSAIERKPSSDARETLKALQAGADMLRAEGYQLGFPESLNGIVWRLLQEAADTLSRLPDRERGWLMAGDRIAWPTVIHSAQEQYEAELQRLIDLKEEKSLTRLPKLPIADPTAIPRMLTVLSWLRFVRARNLQRVKRDRLVVLAMAQGQPQRVIRRLMLGDKGDSAARMVKQKVLKHICDGLISTCNLSNLAAL
jgi:hypothetical protein